MTYEADRIAHYATEDAKRALTASKGANAEAIIRRAVDAAVENHIRIREGARAYHLGFVPADRLKDHGAFDGLHAAAFSTVTKNLSAAH